MKLTASIGEFAARQEMWVSFANLLRAYLAAACLGQEVPQAMLVEARRSELHLEGPRKTIKLDLQVRSGEGYWAIYDVKAADSLLDEGAFRLALDGTFSWSGKAGSLEMDALAEALATLVLS